MHCYARFQRQRPSCMSTLNVYRSTTNKKSWKVSHIIKVAGLESLKCTYLAVLVADLQVAGNSKSEFIPYAIHLFYVHVLYQSIP